MIALTAGEYLIGIAAVITTAMPGFLAWIQSRKTHSEFNSKMDKMLALTQKDAKAEGKLEGAAEEKARGVNAP